MRLKLTIVVLYAAAIGVVLGEEVEPTLRILEPWSNVFGGKVVSMHVSVTSPLALHGRLTWRLSAAGHTLLRGETAVQAGPRAVPTVDLTLPIPPVKDGVVYPLSLAVALLDDATGESVARLSRELQVFPEDPFVGRKNWLERLNLHVFDPVGNTTEILSRHAVPFEELHSLDAVSAIGTGVLLIGAGVSVDDYRALPQVVLDAAAAGTPVLCLSLQGGDGPVPIGGTKTAPERILLAGTSIIRELGKGLDAVGWAPDGRIADGGVALRQEGGAVIRAAADEGTCFSWVELDVEKGAKAIMCWFGITERWDAGPTPRFLFVRLLERVSKTRAAAESR